jgi:NhaP-type Na+/H+ and K+/H+ antiporter
VQEVTEKLGQSDATALTEKDALSLISSESREALNTTLAKQPTRQNFEKVQHRAKHAFNKATSKTYADNFKAYKKDLTALKKEAAAVNQEKTVASEEASKGDKIKTTRISPR